MLEIYSKKKITKDINRNLQRTTFKKMGFPFQHEIDLMAIVMMEYNFGLVFVLYKSHFFTSKLFKQNIYFQIGKPSMVVPEIRD